ncbi:retrovirus-related pol polyprotein from transposon TNT 1-94 [Tanacetum coccineum]
MQGNPKIDLQDQGVIDSGCSRHMTGNMSYLTNYEDIDGGYVTFGGNPKGGKITSKGIIKTGNFDFENVYFVRELKFNLFSMSQMCDKKNSVIFNDTECIVLSPNFKLTDESHVLLKVPRKNNMYSVDLKNIVPKGGLTCLFAQATSNESKLWHRRLGHINFKTMNKLVKGNLVRGLPSKLFENNQTLIACQKRKQHRASCKSKTNKEMNQFCERKGIKREFSVARTPQQNGIAKKKNRTLIEAARTMLADSKLPTTFWAKAVNTACYVQIKFDGKADEGFFVGYSINSKAFRVFNNRTRIVKENLHVQFSKNTSNIVRRHTQPPPIDQMGFSVLMATKKFNELLSSIVGNSSNVTAGNKSSDDAGSDAKEVSEEPEKNGGDPTSIELPDEPNMLALEDTVYLDDHEDVGAEANINNLDAFMHVWTLADLPNGKRPIGTKWVFRNKKDERGIVIKNKARLVAQRYTQEEGIDYDEVFAPVARIEAIELFLAYASFKDFVVYHMDVKSTFLYGKIEEEVYICQPPGFEDPNFPDKVYKVENVLYGLHQAPRAWYETLSTYLLDNGFQRGKIDKTLFVRRDKVKQKEDGIFISQDKYVTEILKKFCFTDVKTASTPMETQKLLLKDKDGEEVNVHLYRSMIGSLMYLTSLRPDIMFAVCACARYQVNPKVSHLYVVKRIFRYLKGQPKLGLWYLKDSPFDLVAYTDSDYAGASLDRKSTTRGCQFHGSRLISWQCKKQTMAVNSTTEAEYAAASSCYEQVLWIQNQLLDYGDCNEKKLIHMVKIHTDKNVVDLLTKAFDVIEQVAVRSGMDSKVAKLGDTAWYNLLLLLEVNAARHKLTTAVENCLPNATIFEELTRMGAKTTTWNGFSSTMVFAIIYLVTNQKFNFSMYIFESMVKNLDNAGKFLMYPRVLDLENTMTAQAQEITSLKLRVKKLEKKRGSRTHKLKRSYKVGRSARVISSDEASLVKQKEDGIFISQDKYVTEILKKFSFTDVKTASTHMETQKLVAQGHEDGEEVDVHLYRSIIGSLMYLTSSRPDIMFALQALVDGKKIIVTEASVRRNLQPNDEEGTDYLPNATIFEELTRIGNTMASTIICLATNQKFNFSKYIFESMVKNLDNAGKFLMYPRSRRPKRKDTKVPQPNGPTTNVADEVVFEEMDNSVERAATTATSLDEEQDRGNINKTKSKVTLNETSSLVTSSGSGPKCQDTMGDTIARTRSARVISSDEASLGDQEDASKQGRKINDIDKDAEITLVHETQGRYGDEEMFDTGVLDGDEVLAEPEVTIKDVNLSVDKVTLAQALAALKRAKVLKKANVVEEPSESIKTTPTLTTTTAATTITAVSTRPRAKGLVIHEEKQATTPTGLVTATKLY